MFPFFISEPGQAAAASVVYQPKYGGSVMKCQIIRSNFVCQFSHSLPKFTIAISYHSEEILIPLHPPAPPARTNVDASTFNRRIVGFDFPFIGPTRLPPPEHTRDFRMPNCLPRRTTICSGG